MQKDLVSVQDVGDLSHIVNIPNGNSTLMWYCAKCGYFESGKKEEDMSAICPKCGKVVSYCEYSKWKQYAHAVVNLLF